MPGMSALPAQPITLLSTSSVGALRAEITALRASSDRYHVCLRRTNSACLCSGALITPRRVALASCSRPSGPRARNAGAVESGGAQHLILTNPLASTRSMPYYASLTLVILPADKHDTLAPSVWHPLMQGAGHVKLGQAMLRNGHVANLEVRALSSHRDPVNSLPILAHRSQAIWSCAPPVLPIEAAWSCQAGEGRRLPRRRVFCLGTERAGGSAPAQPK